MVQQAAGHAPTPLRAITQRLTSTPPKQLPYIVPYLANALTGCADQFSEPQSHSRAKDGSDAAVLVHKYKTQISTLLQEKSVECRWAAVVLIKATVEVGGWEVLHETGPWTRGLIGILGVCRPNVTRSGVYVYRGIRDSMWKGLTDLINSTEAGSCNYKETLYNHIDENISTHSRVSNPN